MKRLLLAIALLLGLADVAAAQNVTCATRPVTDNSNACANTAFVNSYVNKPASPIYSTAHTWLATQTFSPSSGLAMIAKSPSTATPTPIADTATLAKFYVGSSGTPVTSVTPTVSISRYDNSNITSGGIYNNALFTEIIANGTSPSPGLAPNTGIMSRVVQNGQNDSLGIGVEVVGGGGGGHYAYGYFYNVWAKVASQAAYGLEGVVVNDSLSVPYAKGATNVYYAHFNVASAGAFDVTAGLHFWQGIWGTKQDVGVLGGINSIRSALIWDDSSGVTSYKDTGTHTDGIDLTQATYSGSAIKSTGFTLGNTGTISSGVWNGTTVGVAYGGTGLASYTLGDLVYASAATTLSKLAGNTTTTRKFLRQTGDGTNSAAPAWDTVTAADVPGSALTKTDDTNVTLTLGGSPTTALLNAASITVGWAGTLAASRGGTGLSSLGTGVATWLGTPSSANLAAALTDETGTGVAVFATSPSFTTDIRPASSLGATLGASGLNWGQAYLSDLSLSNSAARNITVAASGASTVGRAFTVAAGGSGAGTNLTGGNLILSGGGSTGNGGGGSVLFYAADVSTGSGTTANTPAEMVRVFNTGGFGGICFRGASCSSSNYAFLGGSSYGGSIFNAETLLLFRLLNGNKMMLDAAKFEVGSTDLGGTIHLGTAAYAAPSISACGSSPSIVGTDTAGEVTMGTGSPTGCTITFNLAYTSAPFCTITWQGNPLATQNYTVSTSAITLTQTATSSNKVNYTCIARSGG